MAMTFRRVLSMTSWLSVSTAAALCSSGFSKRLGTESSLITSGTVAACRIGVTDGSGMRDSHLSGINHSSCGSMHDSGIVSRPVGVIRRPSMSCDFSITSAVDLWAVEISGRSGISCLKRFSYGLVAVVECTCRFMESIASGSASHHSVDSISVIHARILDFSTPFACSKSPFVWGVRGLLWTTGIPCCLTSRSHAPLNYVPLSHWRIPGIPNSPMNPPKCNATFSLCFDSIG
jgi:hypothetical protein